MLNVPMEASVSDQKDLEDVRRLEQRRATATGQNDVFALAPLLDQDLVYITSNGEMFGKREYLKSIETHALTYETDFEIGNITHQIIGDAIVMIGTMKGHARQNGEQLVFNRNSLSVWRRRSGAWTLSAWQSAAP